jgi:Zn-finger nucleic acid-binding protein
MLCPNCDAELVMSDRQGVEIDYCPKCRGVWLDRGELDKIIERSALPAQKPAPRYQEDNRPYYDDDDDHRYPEKKKRKSSFLDDLFDF